MPVITRSTLSSRGDVQVDARTNTLIIRDLADRLTAAAELVADARSPAAAGRNRSAHRAAQSQQRARPRHPVGLQRPRRSGVRHQHRPGVPEQRRPDGRHRRRQPARTRRRSASRSARSTARSTSTSACARSRATARAASCRRRASPRRTTSKRKSRRARRFRFRRCRTTPSRCTFKDAALTLARHAADHRVEHRDHAHLRREGGAELHADHRRRSRFRRSTRSAR